MLCSSYGTDSGGSKQIRNTRETRQQRKSDEDSNEVTGRTSNEIGGVEQAGEDLTTYHPFKGSREGGKYLDMFIEWRPRV